MGFFGKLFRNKSIVTIVAIVVCLAVLFFAYRYRVNTAINAVNVPIAQKRLEPREEITKDSFKSVKVARSMLSGNVIISEEYLIGKYVNYNTYIPKGSMFYDSAVVTWDKMPDSAWADIKEGYTVISLSVNASTTYGNSIFPGDKIDLYYQNVMGSQYFIGPLITGIEVLAVKDENGSHIFKKSAEQTQAAELIFAVPDEMFSIIKRANYISGGVIMPIPRNATYNAETVLGNEAIIDYINTRSKHLDPDIIENVDIESEIKVTE